MVLAMDGSMSTVHPVTVTYRGTPWNQSASRGRSAPTVVAMDGSMSTVRPVTVTYRGTP
jgi:hypothetical protein